MMGFHLITGWRVYRGKLIPKNPSNHDTSTSSGIYWWGRWIIQLYILLLLLSTRNARNVNWPTKIQRCENVELFSGSGLWSFSGFSFWIEKWTPDQTQKRNELFPRRSVLTQDITGLDATLSLCSITLSLVVWILISCNWAQNRIISSLVLIRTQSNNYIYPM